MIAYNPHQFWFDINVSDKKQCTGTRTVLIGFVFSVFLHLTGLGLVWIEILDKGIKLAEQPVHSISVSLVDNGKGNPDGQNKAPEKPAHGVSTTNKPLKKKEPKKPVKQRPVPEKSVETLRQVVLTEPDPAESIIEAPSEAAPPQGASLAKAENHGSTALARSVDPLSVFTAHVVAAINKHRYYPTAARRRGIEGKSTISFRMNRDGHVSHIVLTKSTGHRILDKAAQKTVHAIDGSLKLPDEIKDPWLDFSVPIAFTLY